MHKEIFCQEAPPPVGPYSQGVSVFDTLLFISGQIPMKPCGTLVRGSIEDQVVQIFSNIKHILARVNFNLNHVVKTTVFLSSMDHLDVFNQVYALEFGHYRPARSTLAVAGLPRNVDVEIECIASAFEKDLL